MRVEADLEKKLEDLCYAIIGVKPIRGMPMPDAVKIVISALEAGLQYKLSGNRAPSTD